MRPFDTDLIEFLEAGQVDYRDAVEFFFDSGEVRLFIGGRGRFSWDDSQGVLLPWMIEGGLFIDAGFVRFDKSWDGVNPPEAVFYGSGSLVTLDVPADSIGSESQAITAQLVETYMVEGSDSPINTFDDDIRATIDEEPWQGRPAVLSVFWIGPSGLPLFREQVTVREMDSMPVDIDKEGNPIRSIIMEEPDIIQRDIEGKTANAAFQALIDPTDRSFEHVGTTVKQMQKINFGRIEGEA